jgi:DNA-binding cell septation regulator SpoVG
MFEVKRITNVNWENSIVRATLDLIVLPHGIVLKDCMLKEGQHGFFVTSPSQKLKNPWTDDSGKTHEYKDLAFFPVEIRPELEKIVMEAYDPEGKTAKQTKQTKQTPQKTLQSITEEEKLDKTVEALPLL